MDEQLLRSTHDGRHCYRVADDDHGLLGREPI